jgi:hypothetical protein
MSQISPKTSLKSRLCEIYNFREIQYLCKYFFVETKEKFLRYSKILLIVNKNSLTISLKFMVRVLDESKHLHILNNIL